MQHFYRQKAYFSNFKNFLIDSMHLYFRNAGIYKFLENVMKFLLKCILHLYIGIYINWSFLPVIKCPYIVESGNMVFMFMCKYYGIKALDFSPQHLVSEIRARINDDHL